MRYKVSSLILISLMVSLTVLLGACTRASTLTATIDTGTFTPTGVAPSPIEGVGSPTSFPITEQPYPVSTSPGELQNTSIPYPQPSSLVTGVTSNTTPYPAPMLTNTQHPTQAIQVSPTATPTPSPTATETSIPPSPVPSSPTPQDTQPYPGPQSTPTSPYPGPINTPTFPAYPGPITNTPQFTTTSIAPVTPSPTFRASPTITNTPPGGTPRPTPTELPPNPPISPPPAGSNVTIWHAWGPAEADVLQSIVDSFRRYYPDVTFKLIYVPKEVLYQKYYEAAYFGGGPSLLLGPSEWGPKLFDEAMITDLNPYLQAKTLENINKAALSSGKYKNSLVSLPLSMWGQVMFRNTSIIQDVSDNFDDLIKQSQEVTRGGIVGSYLERGSYFSAADILGLGGQLMDEGGYPIFNDTYGLEWLNLLSDYDEAGAVTFNTNRDIEMFKKNRVGIIIEGTWNISMLAKSIGIEKLAIDPWPSYGTGDLSGWVHADSVFVNSNTKGNDLFAALSFAGYLLDPNVQMRLAEVGHIPSVITTEPRDALIQQAMLAFSGGVLYPNNADDFILSLYWNGLDGAIKDVFVFGVAPEVALQKASDNIYEAIKDLRTVP